MILLFICAVRAESGFLFVCFRGLNLYSCFLVKYRYGYYSKRRPAWPICDSCCCFFKISPPYSLHGVSFEGDDMRPAFCNWYMSNCYSRHEAQACPLVDGVLTFRVIG